MVRKYEVVIVIDPKLEEEALEAVIAKYSNIITDNGGEIIKLDRWGKRRLAYEINDLTEGFYVVSKFSGEPAVIKEMERQFGISDDVIRHLIVRDDE